MGVPVPAVPANNLCSACQYWHVQPTLPTLPDGSQQGQCRLNPPSASASAPRTWPVTYGSDWCGQYKQGAPQGL